MLVLYWVMITALVHSVLGIVTKVFLLYIMYRSFIITLIYFGLNLNFVC
jgi:hypothetical protein